MIGPVTGRIGAINAMNNAAYSWMNSADALISMTGNPSNISPRELLAYENKLRMSMLNDSLTYKAAELQEKTCKKLSDENIKRSFSTFA